MTQRIVIALTALPILLVALLIYSIVETKKNIQLQGRLSSSDKVMLDLQSKTNQEIVSVKAENSRIQEQLDREIKKEKCGTISCEGGRCYGVQYGDTLSGIALRFYGRASHYLELAEINSIKGPNYVIMAESCICLPATLKGRNLTGGKPQVDVAPLPAKKTVSEIRVERKQVIIAPSQSKDKKQETAAISPQPLGPSEKPRILPESKPVEKIDEKLLIPGTIITGVPEQKKPETPFQPLESRTIPLVKGFPGSFYGSIGNATPVESGNIISAMNIEQGVTIWRDRNDFIVPFISITTSRDTDDNDWNNRHIGLAGVKVVHSFSNGMIQGGVGLGIEERYRRNAVNGQLTIFGNHWFGNDIPTADSKGRKFLSGWPFSTYGSYGNLSPFEKNNYIAAANAQQGVNLARIGRISIVPYGELTGITDRFGYSWNNKYTVGGGIKAVVPLGNSVFEIGPIYRSESRWKTNERNNAFGLNISLWSGWNPSQGAEFERRVN
jgi:hypothetical protein